MTDKTYRYSGPNSAVTLTISDGKGQSVERDVMLWRGREVRLPEDHPYTQQLLAQRLIEAVSPPAPAPAPATAPAPAAAKKLAAASTPTATE